MKLSRRELLKKGLLSVAGSVIPLSAFQILEPEAVASLIRPYSDKKRYAFVVDTTKCVGCGMCVKACKLENEIPFEADVQRTWVEGMFRQKVVKSLLTLPGEHVMDLLKTIPRVKQCLRKILIRAFLYQNSATTVTNRHAFRSALLVQPTKHQRVLCLSIENGV